MLYYARRANKVIRISEENIKKYLTQGYDVTDEKGTVLKEAVPDDKIALQTQVKQYREKIISLNGEIATLKSRIAELESKLVESPKEDKPKRSRKPKAEETEVVETIEQ